MNNSMEILSTRYNLDGDKHTYKNTENCGPKYQKEILTKFTELLPDSSDTHYDVLDIASGSGETSEFMVSQGLKSVNLDITRLGLKLTKDPAVQAEATALPFREATFRGVHMKDALVHIGNRRRLFAEMVRVLIPEGIMVLTTSETRSRPYFSYTVNLMNRNISLPATMYFKNTEDYYTKVVRVMSDPATNRNSISPPYYPNNRVEILIIAEEQGLKLIKAVKWQPPQDNPDWYSSWIKRSVFFFRKTGNNE